MTNTDALLSILDIRSGDEHTHDPYGALCAMFDIAHALYWLDPNAVPAHWGFRPGAAGGLDYAKCAHCDECSEFEYPSGDECGVHTSGECATARDLLLAMDVDLSNPYSTVAGQTAERTLVEIGNELNTFALLYRD